MLTNMGGEGDIYFHSLSTILRIICVLVIYKAFPEMWHKAQWMGHPMQLKLIRVGFLV